MKKLTQKIASVSLATVGMFQVMASNVLATGSVRPAPTTTNQLLENFTEPKGFSNDIGNLINGVLSFVMVIAALLVFFYLIWGGIEWITSGGDKGKTESARNKITAAVVGLIILAASYAILLVALRFIGFGSLQEATEFKNLSAIVSQVRLA